MELPVDINSVLLWNGLILVASNFLLNHAKALPTRIKIFFLKWFSVTVEIPENQHGFDFVKKYLASREFLFEVRNVSLVWMTGKDGEDCWGFPPAPGNHYFWYRGKLACVYRSRRELEGGGGFAIFETLTIRFFLTRRHIILDFIRDAERDCQRKQQGVMVNRHQGESWQFPLEKPGRRLDSVFLPEGMGSAIKERVDWFFANERWYRDKGIPHRTGFLLHGPPGNGKTSLIRAIASECDLSITIVSLNQRLLDDGKLLTLFQSLTSRTLIVLEDIDCLFAGRDGRTEGVTFSGLLNALDGVASSEGYILVMTTNHPEVLDPALVRPGRVDHVYEIGNVERGQGEAYFRAFYGDVPDDLARRFGDKVCCRTYSMARVQNHLMKYRDDPEGAVSSHIE